MDLISSKHSDPLNWNRTPNDVFYLVIFRPAYRVRHPQSAVACNVKSLIQTM